MQNVVLLTRTRADSVMWSNRYADREDSYSLLSWRCRKSCLATAFSTSLDIHCRLGTGLQSFKILGSSEAFFNNGVTIACSTGNSPASRERLIILVIAGARIEACSLTKDVGNGSSPRDFAAELLMRFSASSGVTAVNSVRWLVTGRLLTGDNWPDDKSESKAALILLSLVWKNEIWKPLPVHLGDGF